MSHQIETHANTAAALFARVDPWHRLGTTLEGEAFTAEQAMTLGHLGGWDVRKVPLSASEITADGVTQMDVPGFATVRTNPFTRTPEALGVVGSAYHPLQNEEHADFLNRLADESGAIFDTAGSLRGGRQVFVTMRLPESLKADVRHTAWAGYQSVVEYIDHFAPVRTMGDAATARATRLLTSDDPTRIKHKAWAALTPA